MPFSIFPFRRFLSVPLFKFETYGRFCWFAGLCSPKAVLPLRVHECKVSPFCNVF
jgi:hypothetical protein